MNLREVEWPTLLLIGACYLAWGLATTVIAAFWLPAGIVAAGLAIALFASLQHEVIHGHPFRDQRLNAALVFPALTLVIPYGRFRDMHMDHHRDATLTDPYEDPETNYFDPDIWETLPRLVQMVLAINNTLAGRLILGPLVGQITFMLNDLRAARESDVRILPAWLWHIPALIPVLAWLIWVAAMPFWAYLVAAYMGLSILKIRTFLEHQAHERARGRTVIIEDRGPLAFMFLNNNLHVVHHMHPKVPWYRLPALYFGNRERYVARNDGYLYRSYGEIFRRYLFAAKDPVPHPIWRGRRHG